MPKRILVVEDEDFTRAMLTNTMEHQGFEVSFSTASPRQALAFAHQNALDAALLDLHLGKGPTGLDLAWELRRVCPNIGLVMVTSYEDPRLLRFDLPSGPPGMLYLTKKSISTASILVEAIWNSLEFAGKPEPISRNLNVGALAHLTSGQIELLRMMGLGLNNAEIARRKFITEKSVEIAITRLIKAMGIEKNPNVNQRVHIAKVYFEALGMRISDEV